LVQDEIISVRTINGQEGNIEGKDYRGEEVFAYSQKIEHQNWYLISKIDRSEILASVNSKFLVVFIALILLISAFWVMLFLYWKNQRIKFFKKQYEAELDKLALNVHYEYLTKYANDIIIMMDSQYNIKDVNEKALITYGYTREEILKLNIKNLRAPDTIFNLDEVTHQLREKGGMVFETYHSKKDGTIFPVEVSARVIDIEGKFFYQSIVRDITDRKKAEAKLISSENRLRAIFEGANDAIMILDGDTVVEFNKAAEEMYGLDRENLLNKKPWELSPEYQEDGKLSKSRSQELIKSALSGKTEKFIWTHLRNQSEPFSAEIILNPFLVEDKKYLMIILRDVTKDINKEKELTKSREQVEHMKKFYENILESIIEGVWVTDENDCIIYANSSMSNIADTTNKRLLNLNIFSDIKGNTLLYFKPYYLKAKSVLAPVFYESVPITQPSGKKMYLTGWMIPIIKDGKYDGMICSAQEVSDKIAAIEEIRYLSRAVEQSPALIVITDLEGNIEYINTRFTETTGYGIEEVTGRKLDILKSGHPSDEAYDILWDIMKSGEEFRSEFLCKKKNGELFWVDSLFSPIKDDKGIPTHYLSIKEDITEGKKIEQELIIAKENAEEMSRLKSNFLANMSHELRTPMSAILGFADLLYERLTDPELKEMSEIILSGSNRLTQTLNSILDLSRIEADKFDLKLAISDIVPVIKESIRLFEAIANGKNIKLEFVTSHKSIFSKIDEKLFGQIFNNLINNALKFTKEGSVSVIIDTEIKDGTTYAIIKVKDTGIGISANKLNLIFEPFRQVSEGLSRMYEGTGLGLTLTKRFIEAMHGSIEVESKLNTGTTFTVKLEVKDIVTSAGVLKTKFQTKKIPGKEPFNTDIKLMIGKELPKILIVEDDEISLKAMQIFLRNICTCDSTDDGYNAIELAKKNKYRLILMDIGLKGIDGIESAKEIKQIPGYKDIPVVAVTAFAMEGDKEKIISESIEYYISKPFDRGEFARLVKDLLNKE
jgi:PAS domain S-box-containing protein